MSAPRLRITCCLCRKPVPLKSDVYALDLEWQRRYPQMVGILACDTCAVSSTYFFRCRRTHNDAYVPGHPSPASPGSRGRGRSVVRTAPGRTRFAPASAAPAGSRVRVGRCVRTPDRWSASSSALP